MTRNLEVFQAVAGFMQSLSAVVTAYQRLVKWFTGGQQGPSPVRAGSGPSTASPGSPGTFGTWQPANKQRPKVQEVDEDLILPEPAITVGPGGTHYREDIIPV